MKTALLAAMLAAALAGPALAEPLELQGATSAHYMLRPYVAGLHDALEVDLTVAPVGTSQAMLDLIAGRADVAVITVPLADAIASARIAAWSESRRLLVVDDSTLRYHEIPHLDPNGRPLAFVTRGDPALPVARVIAYLASRSTR
jgi:hypothetical protein